MTEPHETAPALSLAELEALIATKEQEAKALTETLGAMWQQRQAGTLPKEQYADYMYFEDQLRVTLQTLERVQPQLTYARNADAFARGKAHHDGLCAAVAEQGARVCQAYVTFVEACAALVQVVDAQIDPVNMLTRPDGQPAFELDSGRTTLLNMLNTFPNTTLFAQSVLPSLSTPLTHGQAEAILSHVKGRQPLSENLARGYLALFAVDDKPMEDL